MYKLIFVTKRKAGLSQEEYFQHYAEVHFPLATAIPGLISYNQMPIVHGAWYGSDSFPDYDAVSEYTFESKEAADLAYASPEGIALNEDTGEFIDWDTVLTIPVEVNQSHTAAKHWVKNRVHQE
ncbi:EthD family reductase [Arthrobacter globiformis]|uniref:EthD family reductase n=1 Tax=Arthrobacter globiformis TaxID=1665 RepID=UPI0027867934|nr:EthD family reductase [Arthrobacter globiformis]MDQ0867304.1 uncharacterized protein (TIGR02118 family) [Arthrobacter globiformis]